jgi:hypothetical protein
VSPSKSRFFTRSMRRPKLVSLVVAGLALGALPACTDLTEQPASSITPENFYRNTDEVMGGLASVYAQLRRAFPGYLDGGYWTVSELSSDEMIVPTRGTDWFDNGRHLELDGHTWTSSSPSGSGWPTASQPVGATSMVVAGPRPAPTAASRSVTGGSPCAAAPSGPRPGDPAGCRGARR